MVILYKDLRNRFSFTVAYLLMMLDFDVRLLMRMGMRRDEWVY